MKRIIHLTISVSILFMLAGCATGSAYDTAPGNAAASIAREKAPDQNRMLIWRAWFSLEVESVGAAVTSVTATASQSSGYVENQSASGEKQVDLTLRVPVDSLKPVMASLESIGNVTYQSVSSEDVTEQYVDIDAR